MNDDLFKAMSDTIKIHAELYNDMNTPQDMSDLEGTCYQIVYNSNMGGNEIHVHCNPTNRNCSHIIEIDKTGIIKVGDHIKVTRDSMGNYKEVFVNGVDIKKQEVMNSGSYTFENPVSKIEDEEPKASLYNLLDHSIDHLHRLAIAVTSYQLKIFDTREQNPEMYQDVCAWILLIETAIKERQLIESEAWAEKTAKEINEATK